MTGKKAAEDKLFQRNEEKENQSPYYEVPRRAVPEAGERPDDEQAPQKPRLTAAAPAEGDIEVIAEPGAERDVPSAPELGDRTRAVGQIEVARNGEAEHPAKAHGHEGVAGEVEIELQAVAHRTEPRQRCGEIGEADALKCGPECGELVGKDHLAAKPYDEEREAVLQILAPEAAAGVQLAVYVAQAENGPHRQLRKHDLKGRVVDETALGIRVAAVHVDHVGGALKDVKADAQRQRHMKEGKVCLCQLTQIFQKPSHIFEIEQTAEITRKRQNGESLPLVTVRVLNEPRGGKVDDDEGKERQRAACPGTEIVKKQAAHAQHEIAPDRGGEIISGQKDRKEVKEKGKGRKAHDNAPKENTIGKNGLQRGKGMLQYLRCGQPQFLYCMCSTGIRQ